MSVSAKTVIPVIADVTDHLLIRKQAGLKHLRI